MKTGIIIVDHGSRRGESNQMLEELALLFAARFRDRFGIVEPAHMEIAEPSIATAYARCVQRGAASVVVCPFFLGPGKHWTGDIPRLAAEAAAAYPGTRYHVAMPLGIDDLILELIAKRAAFCLSNDLTCDSCRGTVRQGGLNTTASAAPPPLDLHAAKEELVNGQCSSCPFQVLPDGRIIDKRKTALA